MKTNLIKNLLFAFFTVAYTTAFAQPLQYLIRTEKTESAGRRMLSIQLDFYPSASDTSYFTLPTKINWSSRLQRCYRNFKVEGGRFVRVDSIHFMVISKNGNGTVQLQYELHQNFPGEQVNVETAFGPILQPDYLHVPGDMLFLTPRHYKNYEVTVQWLDLPKNWKIQNSFSAGESRQQFKFNSDNWLSSVWIAGEFRVYHDLIFGKPVYFAIRGDFLFDDKTLFDVIKKTIASQREMWEDKDIPHFSVTMLPFVKPKGRVYGRGKESDCMGYSMYQSFAVFSADDCILDRLTDLFNHEMMHDWIGGKINTGVSRSGPSMRWLAEGFTDYYALLNRYRAGFISSAEYLEILNKEFMALHYSDPLAETPNEAMERNYYRNYDLENLPYRRGCILAFYLDCNIRSRSNNTRSLHDLMLDLLDYTYGNNRTLQDNPDFLLESLSNYIAEDVKVFMEDYVEAGKLIPSDAFKLPDYLQITTKTASGSPVVSFKESEPEAEKMWFNLN